MPPSPLSASDIPGPLVAGAAAPPPSAVVGHSGNSSPRTLHPGMASSRNNRRTQSGSTASDEKVMMPDPEHGLDAASPVQGRRRHHGQPRPVGFWDHSLYKVRGHVFRLWARTVLIIVVFILCILSMYWAVLFRVDRNLRGLKVAVVDFDGQVAPYNESSVQPFVGPMVTRMAKRQYNAVRETSVGYTVVPPARYHNDPLEVRRSVYEFDAWAAIIVNANASALLQEAIDSGNSSYDPMGAIQVVVLTAKDETTYYSYIIPQLEAFQRHFMAEFSQAWMQRLASNYTLTPAALARSPAAVNPGIGFSQVDLRPFQPATATPAVSVGLIYLIIIAFFSFSFFLPLHEGHPPLHFWQFIIWRLVASIGSYFLVSLAYSFVSLAFLLPFSQGPGSAVEAAVGATAYGHGSFLVYWILNFIGMIALGIACENVAMVVGQPWTALWLLFWLITNVATSFYSLDLAPAFFRWGYAWPLHNIVEASRHILFDLHSRIGLNFGVLIVWCLVNITLFPFCCYFMRWKTEREKRLADQNKDRYVVITDGKKRVVPKEEGDKPPIRKRGFLRGI